MCVLDWFASISFGIGITVATFLVIEFSRAV